MTEKKDKVPIASPVTGAHESANSSVEPRVVNRSLSLLSHVDELILIGVAEIRAGNRKASNSKAWKKTRTAKPVDAMVWNVPKSKVFAGLDAMELRGKGTKHQTWV